MLSRERYALICFIVTFKYTLVYNTITVYKMMTLAV